MAYNDIKTYRGEQIQLASGRLVFNAKINDVYVNAKRYINLAAGDKVTIDVGSIDSDNEENMFLVNAPKMQLGLERYGIVEPIVKGEELDKILSSLMEALSEYSNMVAILAPTPSLAFLPPKFLQGRLQNIKEQLDNFKSTKSFTI